MSCPGGCRFCYEPILEHGDEPKPIEDPKPDTFVICGKTGGFMIVRHSTVCELKRDWL